MLKGIDVRQRIEFISSQDKSEPKTVFVLKPLSNLELTIFSTINERDPKAALGFFLENSIVEVRNYDTANIKEAVEMLDSATLGEIITEANRLNKVSRGEAKNS